MSTKKALSLSLPISLSAITLGQYQEYMSVYEKNKDVEGGVDFLNKKTLEIFCKIPLSKVNDLPLKHFMFAVEHINSLFASDMPLKRHFKFKDSNGVEQMMAFIPNLEKMSFGEYVDANNYFNDWESAHKLMAVLFRPISHLSGEKYKIRDYDGSHVYADIMKEMPVDIAIGAKVFFYRLSMKLARGTLKFLKESPELLSKSKEILPNGGDGIQAFMRLQEETFLDLMKHQRFHLAAQ